MYAVHYAVQVCPRGNCGISISLSLSLSLSLLFLFLPFLLETKLVWRTLRQELTFLSPPYRMVKNAYRASSLSFFRV